MESNINTIGKRIMTLRKQAGMTQEQLAEKLGVTPQAVSKWENDASCPDISVLPDIARVFGVSTDELLGHAPMRDIPTNAPAKENAHGVDKGGLFFGVLVIVIGAAYLMNQFLDLPFNIWGILWPAVVMGLGISWMMKRFSPMALGVALLGLWFLLKNVGAEMPFELSWGVIWPIILILVGLTIVTEFLRRKEGWPTGKSRAEYSDAEGFVHMDAAFTEDKRKAPAVFKGADLDLTFGSGSLDLRQSEIAPEAFIKADISFGSYELWLPPTVRVQLQCSTAFGAANVHGEPNPDAALLPIQGDVSFGSLEVRYR